MNNYWEPTNYWKKTRTQIQPSLSRFTAQLATASEDEILNYDFPVGEILSDEIFNLDYTDDRLVISRAMHYFSEG